MATLRDMLIEIYKPRQGIIEFPAQPGQGGGNALAILGSGAGMGGKPAAERGGSVPTGSVGGFTGASDDGLRDLGLGFIGGDEFGGEEGQLNELLDRMGGGEQDPSAMSAGASTAFPGRNPLATLVAAFAPMPLSAVAAAVNAIGGAGALDRYAKDYAAISGKPADFGFADYMTATTGIDFGGSYVGGYGGYSDASSFGAAGIENDLNFVDPGVAGPPRAMARSLVGRDSGAPEVVGSAFESAMPGRMMERATRSLDFGLGADSAYGGGATRSGYDRGRDGGSGGGGSAEGGRGGGNVGDTPGERGPGGRNTFHSGGYLSEDMVPGETRGDVPATLQEGEGVLTADAMEFLGGPAFVERINMLAAMMNQFHPSQKAASYHDGGMVRRDYY